MQPAVMLLVSGVIMFSVIEGLSLLAHYYTLNTQMESSLWERKQET